MGPVVANGNANQSKIQAKMLKEFLGSPLGLLGCFGLCWNLYVPACRRLGIQYGFNVDSKLKPKSNQNRKQIHAKSITKVMRLGITF